jgi:excisionase family DNA binding protein
VVSDSDSGASPWLTTAEAAAYLGLSVPSLRQHIYRGSLTPDVPAGRLKGHRFTKATLDAFIRGAA